MQYQVLLNPNRLFSLGVTVPEFFNNSPATTLMPEADSIHQGDRSITSAVSSWVKTTEDIGNVVVSTNNGIPTYVRDVGKVEIGFAPRLGQFGFMKQDDAVEGVILMRVGEQAQVVLKQVQRMTKELVRTCSRRT